MRHAAFFGLLILALLIAVPTTLAWTMHECPLERDQIAIEQCFQAADRSAMIWLVTVGGALGSSILLHILRSRWKYAALAALALGPWLTMRL
jgi:hypothetical protein